MYGDWYSGPNEDGTFSFSTQFEASEVTSLVTWLNVELSVSFFKFFL